MTESGASLASILSELVTLHYSWDIFCKIVKVYAASHQYLEQWRNLTADFTLVESVIATVRRYETGFQLRGLGIWLMDMMLVHLTDLKCLETLTSLKTIDAVLRIFLEHPSHCRCLEYLTRCLDVKLVYVSQICDSGEVPCKFPFRIF
jgi:hypothetical protein